MAKTKEQKKKIVKEYIDNLKGSKGVVILKTQKITPEEANEFRKKLYDLDAKFHVIKNTLLGLALKEAGLPEEEDLKADSHAVVFIKEDIVNASKVLKTFVTETKTAEMEAKANIVSGYLDGEKLTKEQVAELADMPSKEGSIALILGVLDNALSGVLNVLEDPIRSYASVLDQAFKE